MKDLVVQVPLLFSYVESPFQTPKVKRKQVIDEDQLH